LMPRRLSRRFLIHKILFLYGYVDGKQGLLQRSP
jgi:hypothetical protein